MSGSADVRRLGVVLPVVACILVGACASAGANHPDEAVAPDDGAEVNEMPATVVVSNQSWERVTVYISQGSGVWRLGDVEASSTRTLPLGNFSRTLMGGSAYFIARPLAGRPFRSEGFLMSSRGGTPVWTIENHTASSYVTLR